MTAERLATLSDATTRVDCGGERHTIRWTGGDLIALDHDDPEGERAFLALGGEHQRCIEVLDAWARYRSDPRVLSALSRGGGDYLQRRADRGAPRSGLLQGSRGSGWSAYAPLGSTAYSSPSTVRYGGKASSRPDVSDDDGVGVLAGLDRGVARRLVATTTEVLLATRDPSVQPTLEASLFGRVTSALRSWSGRADLEVELVVVDPNDANIVEEGEKLFVRLPMEWVSTVWARDLAVIGDRFALGVLDADTSHVSLQMIDASFEMARPLTVSW